VSHGNLAEWTVGETKLDTLAGPTLFKRFFRTLTMKYVTALKSHARQSVEFLAAEAARVVLACIFYNASVVSLTACMQAGWTLDFSAETNALVATLQNLAAGFARSHQALLFGTNH